MARQRRSALILPVIVLVCSLLGGAYGPRGYAAAASSDEPTLPGDMFYRAVERMRPHLCDRFVFMTGHRGNQRINDFIDSVCGTVLTKPFRVLDLLEMVDFVRLRTAVLMAA